LVVLVVVFWVLVRVDLVLFLEVWHSVQVVPH
jgi:hypothetical protein